MSQVYVSVHRICVCIKCYLKALYVSTANSQQIGPDYGCTFLCPSCLTDNNFKKKNNTNHCNYSNRQSDKNVSLIE